MIDIFHNFYVESYYFMDFLLETYHYLVSLCRCRACEDALEMKNSCKYCSFMFFVLTENLKAKKLQNKIIG